MTGLPAVLAAGLLALPILPAAAQTSITSTRSEVWTRPGHAPGRDVSLQEQAEWEQQQLRREQWRQQRELTRQHDLQQRQNEETLGQRALREQARNRREQGRAAVPDNRQFGQPAAALGSGPPARPQRPGHGDRRRD